MDSNKIEKVVKQRETNLEVFRVITMLLIVAHHYVVNSGLMYSDGPIYSDLLSFPSMFLVIFGAWGKTGINCFVLITGYFMCKSQISVKKFMKLFLEVEFYQLIIYLVFAVLGYEPFSFSGIVQALMPFTSIGSNFVGCFLVFYLIIPFINVLIKNMTEKQHLRLTLLLLFVYTVLGTVLGTRIIINYVSWFIVLYLISSYIRIYPKEIFNKTKTWGVLSLCMIIVSTISVIVCTYVKANYGAVAVHFFLADSNRILAVLTAFCSFLFFKNVKIKYNKFINTIAASAFGVLLIHSNGATMRQWLWGDVLSNVEMYDSKLLVIHAFVSVICIYVVCTIIDILRINFIEKPFFKLWDKYWEKFLLLFLNVENSICEKFRIDTEN